MSHKPIPKLPHKEILKFEEILHIIRIGVKLGISKIRVTGGEPLVRKGVYEFLEELSQINGIQDVSLTTNGVLLKENIIKIKASGIKRINISLDTLNAKKYKKITGYNYFAQVWEGILEAWKMGFFPIKINVVALNGINDKELIELARLTFFYPFHVRFIEYMPIGYCCLNNEPAILTDEIKSRLRRLGKLLPVNNDVNDGPALRYKFEGARGEIGFISPLSHKFCEKCNRLRLTASGQLRPCLLSEYQVDIKGPLRSGCSDDELADIISQASYQKQSEHTLINNTSSVTGQMYTIGG